MEYYITSWLTNSWHFVLNKLIWVEDVKSYDTSVYDFNISQNSISARLPSPTSCSHSIPIFGIPLIQVPSYEHINKERRMSFQTPSYLLDASAVALQ